MGTEQWRIRARTEEQGADSSHHSSLITHPFVAVGLAARVSGATLLTAAVTGPPRGSAAPLASGQRAGAATAPALAAVRFGGGEPAEWWPDDQTAASAPGARSLGSLAMFAGRDSVVYFDERPDGVGTLLPPRAVDLWRLVGLVCPHAGRGDRRRLREALRAEIADAPPEAAHEAAAEGQRICEAVWERLCALEARTLGTLARLLGRTQAPEAQLVALAEQSVARRWATSAAGRGAGDREAKPGDGRAAIHSPVPAAEEALATHRPVPDEELGALGTLPPLKPASELRPVEPRAVEAAFAPDGPLAHALPHYELRPGQVRMARAVAEALNAGQEVVVEAGTGVGKSLAYLVPAVHFAIQNGRRVAVSTNTINLQEQLYHKDVPLLQGALALPLRVAVVKGRSNYLCLRRWQAFLRDARLTESERWFAAKVLLWLRHTTTGDRSELALDEEESRIWTRVAADELVCTPRTCPEHRRGVCPLARARRRAESAHLVVVNHALLLADLQLERKVLPEYSRLIIDEAHHLEDEATEQLGLTVDQQEAQNGLAMLSTKLGPGRYSGLTSRAQAQLISAGGQALRGEAGEITQPAHDAVEAARHCLGGFFDAVARLAQGQDEGTEGTRGAEGARGRAGRTRSVSSLSSHSSLSSLPAANGYERQLRVTDATRHNTLWTEVELAASTLLAALGALEQRLADVRERLDAFRGSAESVDDVLTDLESAERSFRETRIRVSAFVEQPRADTIYWLVVRERGIALRMAPLDVGALLEKQLFSQVDGVVLTSATLQVNGSFGYILNRLGRDPRHTRALPVASPFNYRAQALVCVPADMPDPMAPSYSSAVAEALGELCQATGGQTLVLFTSHAALRTAHAVLRERLRQLTVLGHGIDGPRELLLERFRTSPHTVLLGTSSFWEGIDVIGEALSCLVIVKLPFSVPSDPVFAARSEQFAEPFFEYALPQAALRLKQGFGRLIRSSTDRGAAVILDTRLWTKRYGQMLLRSLPPATIRRCRACELGQQVAGWLRQQGTVAGPGQ